MGEVVEGGGGLSNTAYINSKINNLERKKSGSLEENTLNLGKLDQT
jgi:hypothetical protein